ncbi:class I SAM-dependent methyltransferase [Streptomyces sp. NPDC048441]|uniref:class I SAM-dependent methyltransferase n=1 Tax=Streptomyces sp. NPDC048441 TaxID=3365552 RepID=UPI0037144C94
MTDIATAWNQYSGQRPERRPTNARGETTWFNWTQYPDHGPGVEVLGLQPGSRVLDLGCGKGGNIAHLATLGMTAVGVDVSPVQLRAARGRWGAVPGLSLERADAVTYLSQNAKGFDAAYSVYGAAWFTNPDDLIPLVFKALRPGGVLAFSQRPPVEGCYDCQASYIPRGDDEDPLVVRRWDYPEDEWRRRLLDYGFTTVQARTVEAPAGRRRTGTLMVRAERAG